MEQQMFTQIHNQTNIKSVKDWLQSMYLQQIKFLTNQEQVECGCDFYEYMTAYLSNYKNIETIYIDFSNEYQEYEILTYILNEQDFQIQVFSGFILIVGFRQDLNLLEKVKKQLNSDSEHCGQYDDQNEQMQYHCFLLKGQRPGIQFQQNDPSYYAKFLDCYHQTQIQKLFDPYNILPHESGEQLKLWKMQFDAKTEYFVETLILYQYLRKFELSGVLLINKKEIDMNHIIDDLSNLSEDGIKSPIYKFLQRYTDQYQFTIGYTIQNHKYFNSFHSHKIQLTLNGEQLLLNSINNESSTVDLELNYSTKLKITQELYSKKRDDINKHQGDHEMMQIFKCPNYHHHAMYENKENKLIFFQPSDQGMYLGNMTIYQYKQYLAKLLHILEFKLDKTPQVITVNLEGEFEFKTADSLDQELDLKEHTRNLFKIPQMQSIDYLFDFHGDLNTPSD